MQRAFSLNWSTPHIYRNKTRVHCANHRWLRIHVGWSVTFRDIIRGHDAHTRQRLRCCLRARDLHHTAPFLEPSSAVGAIKEAVIQSAARKNEIKWKYRAPIAVTRRWGCNPRVSLSLSYTNDEHFESSQDLWLWLSTGTSSNTLSFYLTNPQTQQTEKRGGQNQRLQRMSFSELPSDGKPLNVWA